MNRMIAIVLLFAVALSAAAQPVADATTLTLAGARAAAASALEYAREHEAPGGAIAIVDAGGHLVLLERLDRTFAAAPEVAIGKARTAALFKKPTRVFEDLVNKGRTTMVTLPAVTGFTPLQGGVPLEYDGVVVGAIGVSGAASAQQDDDIASAAAAAFSALPRTQAVTHIGHKEVKAAFSAGAPLVENDAFKVHASRRDGPGEAEIHLGDTDIFYVTEGTASFVTGGTLVDPRQTAPGELRGSAIAGGVSRKLVAGDVITIPAGVPHWFDRVERPFVYYVVKSSQVAGG